MKTRTEKRTIHISLIVIGALSVLPIAIPANKTESVVNSTTNSNKRIATLLKEGSPKTAITFSDMIKECEECHPCLKALCDEASAAKHEVQTIDLIAVIIENRDRLPLDVQDALNALQTRAGTEKLRAVLEIIINEAKAVELLLNQLSDDASRRQPWRQLCERVAMLLKDNPNRAYADFAHALMTAKDSYCVLFAQLRIRKFLPYLPQCVSERAKEIDRENPGKGEVAKRIFFEGR